MSSSTMPNRIGRKSLSQSAWRACTAAGSMSSAAWASAKVIVPSMAIPTPKTTVPMKATSGRGLSAPPAASRTLRR